MDPAVRWVYGGKSLNSDFYVVLLILLCGTSLVTHTRTHTHTLHPAASTRSRHPGVLESSSCWDFLFPRFSSRAPSVSRCLSLFISHLHRLLSAAARQLSLPIASLHPPSSRSLLYTETADNQPSVRRHCSLATTNYFHLLIRCKWK